MEKILVIEDDLTLKPMWELIAKRHSKKPDLHWAVNSEVAKKLFLDSLRDPFLFVVVDLFLAGSETGLDFIRFARSHDDKIPIIITSSAEEVHAGLLVQMDLGRISILDKPLNIPVCERVLDQLSP
jgi:response regulator of citrate/malate metabolism